MYSGFLYLKNSVDIITLKAMKYRVMRGDSTSTEFQLECCRTNSEPSDFTVSEAESKRKPVNFKHGVWNESSTVDSVIGSNEMMV